MSGDATKALCAALDDHVKAAKGIVQQSQRALATKDSIIDSLSQRNLDLQEKVEEKERVIAAQRIYNESLETQLDEARHDCVGVTAELEDARREIRQLQRARVVDQEQVDYWMEQHKRLKQ